MRVDAPRLRLAVAIAAVLALGGCGASTTGDGPQQAAPAAKPKLSAKPAAAPGGTQRVTLTRDPEEADSFPLPAGTRGAKTAPSPDDAPAAPRRKQSSRGSEISPG